MHFYCLTATIFAVICSEKNGPRIGVTWKNDLNQSGKKYINESKIILYPFFNSIKANISIFRIRLVQVTSILVPIFSRIGAWWKKSISVQCISIILITMYILFLYQVHINYYDDDIVIFLLLFIVFVEHFLGHFWNLLEINFKNTKYRMLYKLGLPILIKIFLFF